VDDSYDNIKTAIKMGHGAVEVPEAEGYQPPATYCDAVNLFITGPKARPAPISHVYNGAAAAGNAAIESLSSALGQLWGRPKAK
jgi:hypothetical protein